MANTTAIKIGTGLGDIKFGISREELITLLGDPTETDQFSAVEEEDYVTESWHYDEHEFSVSFDEEDNWRLTTIAISSNEALLNDQVLIGKDKASVIEILKTLSLGEMESEDLSADMDNSELVSFVESSINFWFEDGLLSEIQWGVLWEDEDTPKWPA